ncbi:histone-lysine N-methyltransferase SETMAR-like [Uloborus diversus]|uniref:histone-lysine N-methyltransferase SETMAR-like n=1 Tax=Uloborus diversus TaxID=327109 RepID=UPI0024097DEC|nr:histone-lysine N-methyltransferase SETMAR-like [Uloborus diversus]
MLQEGYGEVCMSYSQAKKWHKAFKEGREDVTDEARSGRPSTSKTDNNVSCVRELLNSDRRMSVRLLSDSLNLPKTIVHEIVSEELGMRKICAKLEPKVLTDAQKTHRLEVSKEMKKMCRDNTNFLDNVITGDESWIFEYDPETKRQSAEWHTTASPSQKKARMSKSRVKSMLIVFFDVKGVVHHEFVPPGKTVTGQFYKEVLQRLNNRVTRVGKEIKNCWKLHHDNAPSHTSFVVTSYLTKIRVDALPQPPYSPDLAPPDFFLFPKLKRELKGKHWDTVETIQSTTTSLLKSLSVEDFQGAFNSWKSRWQKCIDAEGSYFEDF